MAMATGIRTTATTGRPFMSGRHSIGITVTAIIIRDATTIGITGTGDKKAAT